MEYKKWTTKNLNTEKEKEKPLEKIEKQKKVKNFEYRNGKEEKKKKTKRRKKVIPN